ncbi:MAG TPA: hypothetical protein VKB45_02510 [Gemmatimonadales bacterium]|nr:hypothetical protein [Gemmatimonadales bacterium]
MCPAGVTLGFGITARLVRDRRAGLERRTPSGHRLHPLPRQFGADTGRNKRTMNGRAMRDFIAARHGPAECARRRSTDRDWSERPRRRTR